MKVDFKRMVFSKKRSFLLYIILFTISFFPGCIKKEKTNRISFDFKKYSLFIDMPRNITVFENIGFVLYELLWDHFQRVGFVLEKEKKGNYVLETKIEDLDQEAKFVSLDVLPYNYKTKIVLTCQLFDPQGNLVSKRDFSFSRWVSRSNNPVQGPGYLSFQYKQLLASAIPRIDQHFRKELLKNN